MPVYVFHMAFEPEEFISVLPLKNRYFDQCFLSRTGISIGNPFFTGLCTEGPVCTQSQESAHNADYW
jgi:hypothetical protein